MLPQPRKTIVKLTFLDEALGMSTPDPEVYSQYIASNAPNAKTMKDEVAAVVRATGADTSVPDDMDPEDIDKWGTDSKHNILYISGISGSGKSTIASSFKNDKTNVIHLDSYFEQKNIKNAKKNREPEFDIFLAKNKFNPDTLSNNTLFNEDIKGFFKKVDEFTSLTEKFGREQYSKNKRVILEGVQLIDETMYPNKTFFDDKPCIRTTTDVETSRKRANDRDSIL